ncbi:hypothetical protein MIR68_003224 [Amoeboaphelidium protococcarum]|nr:hypothetical protein MIR68_003224 [Amoeboaphelidium protococcarum]
MSNRNYCFERVKNGATTGGIIGLTIGTIYGGVNMISVRDATMGQRLQLVARTVAGFALSFGFFLAIGSAIRCDSSNARYADRRDVLIKSNELDLLYNDDEVPSYTQQAEEKKRIPTESAKQAGSKNDQVIAPSGGKETQPFASETPQINVEFAHDFEDEVVKPATTIKLTDNASQLEDVPPTRALYISDLEWWTSDNDLMIGCVEGLETAEDFSMRDTPITNIVFLDHKVNGKSKGVAYVEFKTEQDAIAARARLSLVEFSGKKARVAFVNTIQLGSPFLDTPLDSLGKAAISNPSLIPGNKDVNQQFEHKSHRGGRGRGGGSYRGRQLYQS